MGTLYRKVEIKSKDYLPKEDGFYIASCKDYAVLEYHYCSEVQKDWLKEVDWYLQPIDQPCTCGGYPDCICDITRALVQPIEPQETIERFSRLQENDPKTKFDAQSIDDILNGLKTDKNGCIRGKSRVIDRIQSLHLQSLEPEELNCDHIFKPMINNEEESSRSRCVKCNDIAEEEPKHPTSWRDFTMTDDEPQEERIPDAGKTINEPRMAEEKDLNDRIIKFFTAIQVKEIAGMAWKGAANAFRKYPDNKHTFSDYWSGASNQFKEYAQNQQPEISVTDVCNNWMPDKGTSATRCANCGKDRWQHEL